MILDSLLQREKFGWLETVGAYPASLSVCTRPVSCSTYRCWPTAKRIICSSANEGAKFWLAVMTELENRGMRHVHILRTDGLKEFPRAIEVIFPKIRGRPTSRT